MLFALYFQVVNIIFFIDKVNIYWYNIYDKNIEITIVYGGKRHAKD